MDTTDLVWTAPTRADLFNYGTGNALQYALHIGEQPVRTDTEMLVDEDTGETTFNQYREYADCTVLVDITGLLTFEYYEGSASGNPEDGERETIYWLQCVAVEAAKQMALVVLADIEAMTFERFVRFGFTMEEF